MPSPDDGRRWSALSHLECPRCGATHDATVRQGVCPACGSPLLACYDLAAVTTPRDEIAAPAAGPVALPRAAAGLRALSTWSPSARG